MLDAFHLFLQKFRNLWNEGKGYEHFLRKIPENLRFVTGMQTIETRILEIQEVDRKEWKLLVRNLRKFGYAWQVSPLSL